MSALYLVIGLVVVQRLVELWVSRRNTHRLLADGGEEIGHRHYPLFVALHTVWLLAMIVFIDPDQPVDAAWLIFFLLLQGARGWVMQSLGRYWTTRIITVPEAPLVRRGPYRYFRHPNYLIVVGEIAALPLAFGAWELALAFSLLNAALLFHRIRVEDTALDARRPLEPAATSGGSDRFALPSDGMEER